MNKYLKYLISLFLAFVVIASDGTLVSQSKSADYYQSSFVILRRELDFSSSRLYKFTQSASRTKTIFSIVLNYLSHKDVFSFQIRVIQNLQILLFQKLSSFIKQSAFVNETIHSGNFKTSLYIA
ncbi:hypothetical protein C8C83_2266 [Flavobacterium sp. 90]|uniref:hypothetical protein n=1 Tax=unclassified Flavobacterium TaxID=196869 RepID=UPI000F2AC24C|nr:MULTISPECIES: hypothetical protein [unclassified Flavobacterium]RKR10590.1 hypothetical protein C8C82_2571 [Flavobacterium sp. 81]TCK54373.1 hypothetical protein C8C83_2266 [Flavobacterium sp. 90]